MALMPEPVNTRKIALAAEYGAGEYDVIAGRFTDEYFEAIRRPIRTDVKADYVRVEYAPIVEGERVLYRVYWLDEDRRRAREAIDGDWYETIGPERARALAAFEVQIKCHQLS